MILKEKLAPRLQTRRIEVERPDGGIVSVDFADDEVSRSLPDSAPLLGDIISAPSISLTLCVFCVIIIYGSVTGILHTITGSSADQVKCSRHALNT